MPIPIQPLQEAELPERNRPILKMIGPGVVLAGLAIGSGELIMWPWITSVVGAQLLWAAAIGIFLQLWVNIEIGRWTIVTGESPFTGMARVIKLLVYLFVFVIFVGKFLPGWARETGIALRDLIFGPQHDSPPWVWTALVFGLVAAILFGPKVIYTAVERCIMGLIAVIVAGLIYLVWEIGSAEIFMAMWDGVVNVFSFPDFPVDILADDGSVRDQLTFNRFFGAVVFAGAGGLGNLYYAYYLREKDIGMGARMPSLMSAAHKHEIKEMDTGYVYEETPENRRRFKDWFRYVVIDQTLFFWILGSVTMFPVHLRRPRRPASDRPRARPGSLVWISHPFSNRAWAPSVATCSSSSEWRPFSAPARWRRWRQPYLFRPSAHQLQVRAVVEARTSGTWCWSARPWSSASSASGSSAGTTSPGSTSFSSPRSWADSSWRSTCR